MKSAHAFMIGSMCLLLACSDDTSTTGAGATLPACEAHTQNGKTDPDYKLWDCKLTTPCAEPVFYNETTNAIDMDPAFKPHFDDIKAAECVLTALRDRTSSAVTYHEEASPIPTQSRTSETIFLLGGDKAVANYTRTNDLEYEGVVKNRVHLKPASYFDGCLAMTTEQAMFDCLESWSDGCLEEALTCP